ncbi:MAG: AAA family ATPase [Bacteroidetes bacterium]|nr:helicase [Bacteroidota bacterium]MBV6460020.1 RecBCD enzyme subunit RecD [Flavobacteriales bacterium]WKZ76336.1 MAG: helix-turn-helix domain-containing protein [Vicingaceae bacterium]MCL4816258.1 helix-turn-helix domain-containing protein [Flavobacteriales bacterium]NOG95415.1 AAA family ATPase [Bacteroidota bacterium]
MLNNTENSPAELAAKFVNNTGKHIFLTGKAGTGKTTFLKHIIKNTFKNTVIAAPTGIAAINAGGVTLHSLFQLPFGAFIPEKNLPNILNESYKINTPHTLLKQLQLNKSKRKLIQEIELLIIDEVSMLRADLLDAIDTVLKSVRKKNQLAFGGIQILFIGDLLQLPPVVKEAEWDILKNYYPSAFFFDAWVLRENKPIYIELDKVYRQSDNVFIQVLNNLRNNSINEKDIALLNRYYKPDFTPAKEDTYIQLTTHNYKAENLNKQELEKLDTPSYFYPAEITGDFSEHNFPVENNLELKIGAQIIFIKNDPSGNQLFYNGKIGKIHTLHKDKILVQLDKGKIISVEKYEWENVRFTVNEITNEIEEHVIGSFKQYPIKLAWAITIHKSQGLTFEKAIIDVGKAFAPGQIYVALSRLTSLHGLVLTSEINFNSLYINKEIETFSKAKPELPFLHSQLKEESKIFLKSYVLQCFNFTESLLKLNLFTSELASEKKKNEKQQTTEWIKEIISEFEDIKKTADKFQVQLNSLFNAPPQENNIKWKERINAAALHFLPLLNNLSKKILTKIEILKDERKTTKTIKELIEMDAIIYKQIQQIKKAEAMAQSASGNEILTKEMINSVNENKEKIKTIDDLSTIQCNSKSQKEAKEKKEKTDTKKISFELYQSGLNIEQIALHRKLTVFTIENHLAYYVSLGMLAIDNFVDEEKWKNIITVCKTINSTKLSEIMEKLGEEYTYTDIKFSVAYYQNANKEKI